MDPLPFRSLRRAGKAMALEYFLVTIMIVWITQSSLSDILQAIGSLRTRGGQAGDSMGIYMWTDHIQQIAGLEHQPMCSFGRDSSQP